MDFRRGIFDFQTSRELRSPSSGKDWSIGQSSMERVMSEGVFFSISLGLWTSEGGILDFKHVRELGSPSSGKDWSIGQSSMERI
ncbi:hypothetical protein SLA2020_428970 [Shorea laevis]